MTIEEKYSAKITEVLKRNPHLTSRQIATEVGYKGNHEGIRGLIKLVRKKLGIRSIHSRNVTNTISEDRKAQSFDMLTSDEGEILFTELEDGDYLIDNPTRIGGGRKILVINDVHIGYHCLPVVTKALAYGKNARVNTVVLNGDIFDCEAFSRHGGIKPSRLTFQKELDRGRYFLDQLRKLFAKQEIYYHFGNHENRLQRWILDKAIAIDGLFNLQDLARLSDLGINYVPQEQHIKTGDLNILHGHQIRGSGLNVASTLLNKAGCNIMFGDRHRSQEAIKRTFNGQVHGSWAVGCLCALKMDYCLYNDWVHGFAIVEVDTNGTFTVDNKKIINGNIV